MMAMLRVMLVLSAIAMSVVAFPSPTNEEKKFHMEEKSDTILKHALKPIVLPAENNDSKQKSSFIEFVKKGQDGNSTAEPGKDGEKYSFANIAAKKNISKGRETEDFSDSENINIKNIESPLFPPISDREEKSPVFTYEDTWSLSPIEPSAITETIPKYFFGIFVPNPPFPEMSREQKLKESAYMKDENSENAQPYVMPKKNHHNPYPAGPVLYPQSMYNREFAVPFFE